MSGIRVAIVGVGNCASSLIQGIDHYKKRRDGDHVGLMHTSIGGYAPWDIEVVTAFDVDRRKVGKPLHEAIFAPPNCTKMIAEHVEPSSVVVKKGRLLDGFSSHLQSYPEARRFVLSEQQECDVVSELKESGAEILINFLPVGSVEAVEFYAECALQAGVAFINCIPVFIGSDPDWVSRFARAGLPIIGDDIKSQLGATIVHRVLTRLCQERGVRIDRTYQLNIGGNTDFLNMVNRERLSLKKTSKTEAVQSQLHTPLTEENIHIGPSDYVPWLGDNKICYLRIEGTTFGGARIDLDLQMKVDDSPNSAGVVIDVIRCCKLALERGVSGAVPSVAAYTMKHPLVQYTDEEARDRIEQFIAGNLER
ncbi:inositol-3-phosphate synthase [Brevibacillus humidisoli]|uniref:inositol-3-phosphate synthase n=1 Tax=Brevibacillus humidisoli TaxID=2895522 RepID=UPI001E37EF34|nr:inositol-3-phosphate synthase [Brevibacillus humidisoli]UFJ42514.1 inositol-3-phosphate synthase [Brevibacillus humidisoli]